MKKIKLTSNQIKYIENNTFEKISDVAKYIGCGSNITKRILKENKVVVILNESFTRNCPKCNKVLKYISVYNKRKAEKNKAICEKCFHKRQSINYKGDGNPFYGKTHTKELKDKLSKLNKGKRFSPNTEFKKGCVGNDKPLYSCWFDKYGKTIADEKDKQWKQKLSKAFSGKKNPMYGKPSPIGSGNGWSGWYKGWYFRSLLELSYMIKIIERFNLKWENAEQKKYRISYTNFEGINRNYFPDFIINEKYIVECKPKNLWNSADVLSKKEAAIKFAEKNNLIYKITEIPKLTSKEIKELIDKKEIKFLNRYKKKYENKYKKKS